MMQEHLQLMEKLIHEGTEISLDGTSGKVYMGILDSEESELTGDFAELMSWADEIIEITSSC